MNLSIRSLPAETLILYFQRLFIMVKKKGCPIDQDKVRQLSNEFGFQEREVNQNDRKFKMRFANNRVKYVDVFFSTGTVRLEEKDSRKDTHKNVTVSQMRDIFEKFAVKLQKPDPEEKVREEQPEVGLFDNVSSKFNLPMTILICDSIHRLADKYGFKFEVNSNMFSLTGPGPDEFQVNVSAISSTGYDKGQPQGFSSTVVIQNPRRPVAFRHSSCSFVQLDEFMKNIHYILDID